MNKIRGKDVHEDDLVEELTPTLHEEGEADVSASVESVVGHGLGRDALSGLESGGTRHRILSSDTDSVDEEAPSLRREGGEERPRE
jgi:hypothetical protein